MVSPRTSSGHVSRYFDRIAIGLSAICIVHCIAVPLVLAVLPLAAVSFGRDAHFHAVMLWLVVPTSVAGFALGYRVHGRLPVPVLGAAALVGVATVALWGHANWAPLTESVVNTIASFALAGAHWLNFRDVRRLHRHA